MLAVVTSKQFEIGQKNHMLGVDSAKKLSNSDHMTSLPRKQRASKLYSSK